MRQLSLLKNSSTKSSSPSPSPAPTTLTPGQNGSEASKITSKNSMCLEAARTTTVPSNYSTAALNFPTSNPPTCIRPQTIMTCPMQIQRTRPTLLKSLRGLMPRMMQNASTLTFNSSRGWRKHYCTFDLERQLLNWAGFILSNHGCFHRTKGCVHY